TAPPVRKLRLETVCLMPFLLSPTEARMSPLRLGFVKSGRDILGFASPPIVSAAARRSPMPIVCALVIALLVVAFIPAADAQAPPIRIGASLALTGTYSKPGKYGWEGYQLCIKDLNAKGGLLGRKLELVYYDDRSDAQVGLRLYEELITEDKVDVVMGPYSSAITEAVVNVTEKYRKVMVAPLASTTSIFRKGRKYVFMIVSPAEVYLEGLIDLAAKRGLKTLALIYEDTLFPKASAIGAIELAKKKGLQVL